MSPATHLMASWLIAAKTTNNPRDRRLVALAGILPDVDGLGLVVDVFNRIAGNPATYFYQNYHHFLLHGAFGALVVTGILTAFARQRGRVAWAALLTFHLHLLCDLIGSRGPSAQDLWPILYLEPFSKHPAWVWAGQWRLDGWQNRLLSLALLFGSLGLAVRWGYSFVGVFSQRADALLVEVLRKWHGAWMRRWPNLSKHLKRSPWRTVAPCVSLLAVLSGGFLLWQPGLDVRDGDHDRKRNGIWIGHGWLGADDWFLRNGKTNELGLFRDPARIRELASRLRAHHITDVYPHLCPSDPRGNLPAIDDAQTERFLSELTGLRVLPWIGGLNGPGRYRDAAWRARFIAGVSRLLAAHPRLAGVHLNVEPLPSGDELFLVFLDELHAALPPNKLLSIAAYPPPTRWHRYPDVHWDEAFFRQVARRCDQLSVMMYDTGIRVPKLYQQLMADWTVEVLAWSEGKPVLLGIPTYDDRGAGYHVPHVENIRNALLGIHAGLDESARSRSYQGIALYSEWETDSAEWDYLEKHFLKEGAGVGERIKR